MIRGKSRAPKLSKQERAEAESAKAKELAAKLAEAVLTPDNFRGIYEAHRDILYFYQNATMTVSPNLNLHKQYVSAHEHRYKQLCLLEAWLRLPERLEQRAMIAEADVRRASLGLQEALNERRSLTQAVESMQRAIYSAPEADAMRAVASWVKFINERQAEAEAKGEMVKTTEQLFADLKEKITYSFVQIARFPGLNSTSPIHNALNDGKRVAWAKIYNLAMQGDMENVRSWID